MPQMAPTLWLPLTLFIIFLFFLIKSMVYFLTSPTYTTKTVSAGTALVNIWVW